MISPTKDPSVLPANDASDRIARKSIIRFLAIALATSLKRELINSEVAVADDKTLARLEARLDRIESVLARIPPIGDPPPDDIGRWGGWGRLGWRPIPIPIPDPGDPVPIDISRLSRAQLDLALQSIKAHRVRLDAMETMIKQQIKQVG